MYLIQLVFINQLFVYLGVVEGAAFSGMVGQ